MHHKHKLYSIIVLSTALVLYIVPFTSLLVVDPFQIFHKPWVRDTYFIPDLRLQAAGIINNSEFDSIILGTSMSANFSPGEASDLWNAKFVNISPDGSLLSERSLILNYALRKKKLKNIIISLDGFSEYGKYLPDYPVESFNYLYNENPIDDIKIYASLNHMEYVFCQNRLIPVFIPCTKARDFEHLTEWRSSEFHYKRFGGLDKWFDESNNEQLKKALANIVETTNNIKSGKLITLDKREFMEQEKDMEVSFDHYVLRYIEENPGTKFYLYFPSYSRLNYAMMKQGEPDKFNLYVKRIRYIVNRIQDYKNASVFGFDHLDFLNDIANYKDTKHHHTRYNSEMLKWMRNDTYKLTTQTVDTYIKNIIQQADQYDAISIGDKIAAYLDDREK